MRNQTSGGAKQCGALQEKTAGCNKWLQATIAGSGFLLGLIVAQWPMGNLLISPLAENWIFGTKYYPYMIGPSQYKEFAHSFLAYEKTRMAFWAGMGYALVGAILMTRLGLAWGNWMHRVRR